MSNTLRLLGLEALSSVGDLLWGAVASGEPALILASGGRAKDFLWEKACRVAGFEPSDAARYDRLSAAGIAAPQPETLAAFRLVRPTPPAKPEWFSPLADSEDLFCRAPRPGGDLRVLPTWPRLERPAAPPSRPPAGEFALRPSPVPMALMQPRLALSYPPAAAPADPDWTRLRHPELAHLRANFALERSQRRASIPRRAWMAAGAGTAVALAGIVAAALFF